MAEHRIAQITATLNVQNKHKQQSDIRYLTYAALPLKSLSSTFSISHILPIENVYRKTAHETEYKGNVNNRNTLYMYRISKSLLGWKSDTCNGVKFGNFKLFQRRKFLLFSSPYDVIFGLNNS